MNEENNKHRSFLGKNGERAEGLFANFKKRCNGWDKLCKEEQYCYPKDFLRFNTQRGLHPTQKPTDLLEYLIKTYTNENEVVLDNCMGSGSTGVACINTNRRFIGIELDNTYFEIAKNRIENTKNINYIYKISE